MSAILSQPQYATNFTLDIFLCILYCNNNICILVHIFPNVIDDYNHPVVIQAFFHSRVFEYAEPCSGDKALINSIGTAFSVVSLHTWIVETWNWKSLTTICLIDNGILVLKPKSAELVSGDLTMICTFSGWSWVCFFNPYFPLSVLE